MAQHGPDRAGADPDAGCQGRRRGARPGRSLAQGALSHRRHGQGRPGPSLLEYCAGRSMVPQRAEIRPVPTHSDEDQGGSDRQCRLIQHFRHQIQLLVARPAPAEPNRYVATLECLASYIKSEIISLKCPTKSETIHWAVNEMLLKSRPV